jgi:hypothetical protein
MKYLVLFYHSLLLKTIKKRLNSLIKGLISFNLRYLNNLNVRKIINREKPLALYVFSNNSQVFEDFKHQTSSGSVVLNETLMHLTRKNQKKKKQFYSFY